MGRWGARAWFSVHNLGLWSKVLRVQNKMAHLPDAGGLPDKKEVEVAEVVFYSGSRHERHRGHVDPEISLHIFS
jgi:hypothetical protein